MGPKLRLNSPTTKEARRVHGAARTRATSIRVNRDRRQPWAWACGLFPPSPAKAAARCTPGPARLIINPSPPKYSHSGHLTRTLTRGPGPGLRVRDMGRPQAILVATSVLITGAAATTSVPSESRRLFSEVISSMRQPMQPVTVGMTAGGHAMPARSTRLP